MDDMLICMILRFIWFPIAFISVAAIVFLVYRRMRVGYMGGWIKYPVLLLFLSLIAVPTFDYLLKEDLLPFQCKPITPPPPVCTSITEFSDGSTTKKISFPKKGGLDSKTGIVVPRGVKVDKTRMEIKYLPKQVLWVDEFINWTGIDSYSGVSINEDKGYAFINISRLVVDSTVVLDGSHTFDEVHIKRGGMLTTRVGKKLTLKVNNALIIDRKSGINVDGKGNSIKGKGGDGESTGVCNYGCYASGGGGGGHGGKGGNGGDDVKIGGSGGGTYGSKTKPLSLGSPGGNGGAASGNQGSGAYGAGGLGGGAVRIMAKEVVLNGYISANGDDGEKSDENDGTGGGGGGSGGSIFITTDNFKFRGKISANGGDGGNDHEENTKRTCDGGGGGGSGGRILVRYNIKSGDERISVAGGKGGTSGGHGGVEGGKGTIKWMKKQASLTQLIYANITSVEINPTNLKGWGLFYANATVPAGSEIMCKILDASNNSILCEINPEDALSGYNISGCASGVDALRLHASMVTVSTSITPLLHHWRVYYDTEIKDLKLDVGLDRTWEYVNPSFSGKMVISDDNTKPTISEKITSLVKDCDCSGCSLSKDECTVNLRFSSSSSGTLILKNPDLMYCIPQ